MEQEEGKVKFALTIIQCAGISLLYTLGIAIGCFSLYCTILLGVKWFGDDLGPPLGIAAWVFIALFIGLISERLAS